MPHSEKFVSVEPMAAAPGATMRPANAGIASWSNPDDIAFAVAEDARLLLNGVMALVLQKTADSLAVSGYSAATPELAAMLRARYGNSGWVQVFRPFGDEAVRAGRPVVVPASLAPIDLPGCSDLGHVLAAFAEVGSHTEILLVYGGFGTAFRAEDEKLIASLVRLAGVAITNAERSDRLTQENQVLRQSLSEAAVIPFRPGPEPDVSGSLPTQSASFFSAPDPASRYWMEIFDSISDLVLVHDGNGEVLRVNRSLADFIGVRPEQLLGVNMRALVSMAPDSALLHSCPFCEHEGKGDYMHRVLDRTYLVSNSCVHGTSGEGNQTVHVLTDITDRCEAERRYRELFDSLQEGLYYASPEGRFVEVNDTLVRMLGYSSREELLQVDIASEIYLEPKHWRRFVDAVESSGCGLRNFEEKLRRNDGSAIHMLQNAFALRDAQGRVLQYRGLMLDITDLKNYQAELQRERDFSSKILNHTQSMILVVDTAGLISYANRRCCEAGRYEENGLLGKRLLDLVLAQRRNQMAHAVEMCLLGQQVDNLELPIVLGDGHAGQFSLNLSPMRDEEGNVNSIVVVMTDITDASMLKAKLIHTEKMAAVGQLVSGVAHEVNNPLTAVLGFADLLLDSPEVPESAKKEIGVILQEAQRTKQIVQNLLSFARQTPPQRRPMNVNEVLKRTLALRAYDFANHDIEVIERLDSQLGQVVGDAHQLQQVFLNILNNAYDAVRSAGCRGRIEIKTCTNGEVAEIRFRDNGPGVLQPDRIFDPFFTTKEVGKGTGLGLSICYGIVHEHGGDISCQNNSGSPGATFIVRLPFGAKAAAGVQA